MFQNITEMAMAASRIMSICSNGNVWTECDRNNVNFVGNNNRSLQGFHTVRLYTSGVYQGTYFEQDITYADVYAILQVWKQQQEYDTAISIWGRAISRRLRRRLEQCRWKDLAAPSWPAMRSKEQYKLAHTN